MITINNLKNVDVTLRDGGYLNNFEFSLEYAIQHVRNISLSNVEWIEIGYKNGSFKKIDHIGITGVCDNEYVSKIHQAVPDANLCVICHTKNISKSDIKHLSENGVGFLRLCINLENCSDEYVYQTLSYSEYAKSLGMLVSINAVRVSQTKLNKLIDFVWTAEKYGVDIIYLADSNGSLTPKLVHKYISTLVNASHTMKIGFHAHDNINMAMANSIEALLTGAEYIDSSLLGMGKGSGNLNIESWISYVTNYLGSNKYRLGHLFKQSDSLSAQSFFKKPERKVLDIILGINNLSVEYKENPLFADMNDVDKVLKSALSLSEGIPG
ncbi:beta/alpha barrel domain-containing protein [Aliivibrio fischeri]|uniref:hypothetical protein n=1 Tax=Aliivibrio fischeri TaxID=668 RepID=UPI00084CA88F|nr:hypothetical protein [Aliivibrio fischeri]OED53056.1 hypothetical protein BEI47_18200 [Aliivibrio fischeri]